jgi:antitoxin YxxD
MFEIFKRFVGKNAGPNRFWPVDQNQIDEAESRTGIAFPCELRAFYAEVGSGFWARGNSDRAWDRSLVNRILSPRDVADLLCDDLDPWRPSEGFVEGGLPFFDVGENTYLVLLPNSETPSRVHWPDGKGVVSDDLSSFFFKLSQRAGFYRDS